MVKTTEPRLVDCTCTSECGQHRIRATFRVKDKCPRWVLSVALLTSLFPPSAVWAYGSRHLRERPPQTGTIEATSVADQEIGRVVELPLNSAERQRVLYVAPDSPRASIVMLPGGAENIGLARDGDVRRDDNFVVRTRDMWAAKDYAVVIPDIVDRPNLRGERSSAEYASLVEDLVQFAHSQAPGPVFLLGTSQGSIAAVNGAAHAHPGTLAGVILTESVSRLGGSRETVFDAGLQDISVPALVVANLDDRCDVAPPQDVRKIVAAMNHSPDVRVVEVSGGIDGSSNPCGSLTPHGYYGMEAQVIGTISDWILSITRNGTLVLPWPMAKRSSG